MIADYFEIGCSAIHSIMGPLGLTHKQYWEMIKLRYRRMGQYDKSPVWTVNKSGKREGPLSKRQAERLLELQRKMRYPELPAGAKTVCENWFQNALYGREKEFSVKETRKGDIVEADAISLIGEFMGSPFMHKEKDTYKSDGYIKTRGCDVLEPDSLGDNKSSWDHDTFPLFKDEPESKYVWQVNGYGHLFGRKKLWIAYTLMDCPEEILEELTQKECYRMGIPWDEDVYDTIKNHYTYSDLPIELRVKIFDVEFNPSLINQVHERVEMCREYIRKLEYKLDLSRSYRESVIKRIKAGERAVSLKSQLNKVSGIAA